METPTPTCSSANVTLCWVLAPAVCSTLLGLTAMSVHLAFMEMPSSPRTVLDVAVLPVEQTHVTQELVNVAASLELPDLTVTTVRRVIMGTTAVLDANVAAVVPALPVQDVILLLASVTAYLVSLVLAVSNVLLDSGALDQVVAQSVTVKGAPVTHALVNVSAVRG